MLYLILFLLTIVLLVSCSVSVQAAWWDTNYFFSCPVYINNPDNTAHTYEIIVIEPSSLCNFTTGGQADYDDIHLIQNNVTDVPIMINTSYPFITALINTSASTNNTAYTIYWGNNATAKTDFSDCGIYQPCTNSTTKSLFWRFDRFNNGTLGYDATLWTILNAPDPGGCFANTTEVYEGRSSISCNASNNAALASQFLGAGGERAKLNRNETYSVAAVFDDAQNGDQFVDSRDGQSELNGAYTSTINTSVYFYRPDNQNTTILRARGWHIYSMKATTSYKEIYVNSTLAANLTSLWNTPHEIDEYILGTGTGTNTATFDFFYTSWNQLNAYIRRANITFDSQINITNSSFVDQPTFNETNSTLYKFSDINATTLFTNPNGGSGNITFEWFKNSTSLFNFTHNSVSNGTNASNVLKSGNFSKGDKIYVTAIPFHSFFNGTGNTSTTILVQNSIPNATNISLVPSSPIDTDNLIASANYSDGDNENGTLYFNWYVNNVFVEVDTTANLLPDTNASGTLLSSQSESGQSVIVEIIAYDGQVNSTGINTSVSIGASSTPATGGGGGGGGETPKKDCNFQFNENITITTARKVGILELKNNEEEITITPIIKFDNDLIKVNNPSAIITPKDSFIYNLILDSKVTTGTIIKGTITTKECKDEFFFVEVVESIPLSKTILDFFKRKFEVHLLGTNLNKYVNGLSLIITALLFSLFVTPLTLRFYEEKAKKKLDIGIKYIFIIIVFVVLLTILIGVL